MSKSNVLRMLVILNWLKCGNIDDQFHSTLPGCTRCIFGALIIGNRNFTINVLTNLFNYLAQMITLEKVRDIPRHHQELIVASSWRNEYSMCSVRQTLAAMNAIYWQLSVPDDVVGCRDFFLG